MTIVGIFVLRLAKLLLILTPTVVLLIAAAWFLTRPSAPTAPGESKLLVIVVFDQMRGDYLDRWAIAFNGEGFERIKRDGIWYSNCSLPYACSATGPGHASLSTGATPSVHGIIENSWYDRTSGKLVIASAGDKVEARQPPGGDSGPGLSPVRILAPTISDALHHATGGQGKLFSLALKDRAAVFMGGKQATGVYCFDNGEFHTSTAYPPVPEWVMKFNTDRAGKWDGKVWDRIGRGPEYDTLAGRDDQPGEYAAVITMPKPALRLADGRAYYSGLEASPFGNELLWDFAKTALDAEKLGRRGTSDVMMLSFSSNDIIGHFYGPDSHEVLDVTLRSDLLVADMIKHLDATIGRERYSLIITSDHGIPSLPEVAGKTNPEAIRISSSELVTGLDDALDQAFGKVDNAPGRWVEGNFKDTKPWVYLNRRLPESLGVSYDKVEEYAAKWLANRPEAMATFRRANLANGICLPEEKPIFDLVRNAFHPDRSGDVYIVQKPFQQLTGRAGKGVDHGSLHPYDRKVFLLALGMNVPNLRKQPAPLNSLSITAMACKTLGIEPPAKAMKQLPEGWQ